LLNPQRSLKRKGICKIFLKKNIQKDLVLLGN